MPSHGICRREVESLHDFFVDWYTGQTARDTYDRVEGALSLDFEMVTPGGDRRGYDEVVDGIREQYDSRDPGTFDIEIRNVETRGRFEDHSLVRYEEHQKTATEMTGRLSTVLFADAPEASGDVVWLDLHETWLDGPGSGAE